MSATHDGMAPIEPAVYRQVLGHFPTGVCVVTTIDGDTPLGLAVGSFSSVSLDPPLVQFSVSNTSHSLAGIVRSGRFCVNVLSEHQEDVCRIFAGKGDDKFAGIGWRPSANNTPHLTDVVAHIDCDVHDTVAAGDHTIVLGLVTDLGVDVGGGPLLFFRGGYGRFAI